MKNASFILACITLAGVGISEASTLDQYVERKQNLAELEYNIQLAKKQRELEEINNVANTGAAIPTPDAQIQYFGAQPPITVTENLPSDIETEATAEEKKREQEREVELAALRNAKLIEVYQNTSGARRFVAIIAAGNELHEVWRGQKIAQWEVVGVDLNSVVLRNDVLNARRTVKHVR